MNQSGTERIRGEPDGSDGTGKEADHEQREPIEPGGVPV
jgi:hypothetical protein